MRGFTCHHEIDRHDHQATQQPIFQPVQRRFSDKTKQLTIVVVYPRSPARRAGSRLFTMYKVRHGKHSRVARLYGNMKMKGCFGLVHELFSLLKVWPFVEQRHGGRHGGRTTVPDGEDSHEKLRFSWVARGPCETRSAKTDMSCSVDTSHNKHQKATAFPKILLSTPSGLSLTGGRIVLGRSSQRRNYAQPNPRFAMPPAKSQPRVDFRTRHTRRGRCRYQAIALRLLRRPLYGLLDETSRLNESWTIDEDLGARKAQKPGE